eukprot:CAMPEP_0116862310 /NCGR_PEP_ID=MMETSP0418-20121206/23565_1 /TAXON_ID=1158023 /ORGANISM="Astrosyne radiata, Strain 13vi08-1A" /LENGTH=395 /DNA_ID=CAMNT_0004497145 /DNA_START=30 /DNA_END=1217 /DNA_ORIENTATION=-
MAFFAFVFVLSLDSIQHPVTGDKSNKCCINPHVTHLLKEKLFGSSIRTNGFGGAVHDGYYTPEGAILDARKFYFAAVTDLDQLSRMGTKLQWKSMLLPGVITLEADGLYQIVFDSLRTLKSKHNEGGRGMELSELTLYNHRLLAFDDRTGSVFEILSQSATENFVVPRFVVTEGQGDTDKGMKWEWSTVKDGDLYMGSMGKEYTNDKGEIVNTNNLWIAILNKDGEIRREDWADKYMYIRRVLNASPPGYCIHEAVLWSSIHKKWIFLPRRISSEVYNDVIDEKKGANKMVLINEDFTSSDVVDIQMKVIDPLHGFSTAAFVPNSNEEHILAVRTVEDQCVGGIENVCKQRSYFVIFDLTGKVLMDEVQYPEEGLKFEGVEFVNVHTTAQPSRTA